MGLIKAAALRIDLSIGKAGSGFADLITGDFTPGEDAISYNFSLIDTLAAGLNAQRVCSNPVPYREMLSPTRQRYVFPEYLMPLVHCLHKLSKQTVCLTRCRNMTFSSRELHLKLEGFTYNSVASLVCLACNAGS